MPAFAALQSSAILRLTIAVANSLLLLACCLAATGAFAAPWPGDAGTIIAEEGAVGSLPSGYEPSGAVWHNALGVLLVVSDTGLVSSLDPDGANVTTWAPGGDLEAITVASPATDLVYLGRENPDAVLEFDLAAGMLTGNVWDLTPWMTGAGNQGLESLTYVDGLFYAGHQGEGNVYIFDLLAGGVVQHMGTFAAPFGRDDVSGMHYAAQTGVLYAVHDSFDVIVEMDATGAFLAEFDLPRDSQEGVALAPACGDGEATVFIGEDSGAVLRYEAYPVACIVPGVESLPASSFAGLLVLGLALAVLGAFAARGDRPRLRDCVAFKAPGRDLVL